MNSRMICYVILTALLYTGCNDHKNVYKYLQLTGYKNSNPLIVYLPGTISEVSGIVYYPKDSSVFCIDDNIGILYKFPLYKRKILQKWPITGAADMEALVLRDSTFYALRSNGSIYSLKFDKDGKGTTDAFESPTEIKVREFESMLYDSARNLLLLICKDCEDDAKNTTSVWGYDYVNKTMSPQPVFIIDGAQIEKIVGKKLTKFKPSDAAVHPATGDFYYVSAINDLMIVTDRNGMVKEACGLDKTLFKQPEGLSFMPDGTMLVSNEFADMGNATILIYPYNKN